MRLVPVGAGGVRIDADSASRRLVSSESAVEFGLAWIVATEPRDTYDAREEALDDGLDGCLRNTDAAGDDTISGVSIVRGPSPSSSDESGDCAHASGRKRRSEDSGSASACASNRDDGIFGVERITCTPGPLRNTQSSFIGFGIRWRPGTRGYWDEVGTALSIGGAGLPKDSRST